MLHHGIGPDECRYPRHRMNKLLLFTLIGSGIFPTQVANAQSWWCFPGAEWTQACTTSFSPSGPVLSGVVHAQFLGDTLVGGLITQRIVRDLYLNQGGGEVVHSVLPTVYTRYGLGVVRVRLGQTTQFDTLLWLGAVPGDRWFLPGPQTALQYQVTDTATVLVDGVPLRRLAVVLLENGTSALPDTVYQRIGLLHTDTFGPTGPVVFGPNASLRCYRDNAITYSAPGVDDCDFTAGLADVAPSAGFSLYPNPASGHITVRGTLPNGTRELEVVDATGRLVLCIPVRPGSTIIPLNGLANGVYTAVARGNQAVRMRTFVKE